MCSYVVRTMSIFPNRPITRTLAVTAVTALAALGAAGSAQAAQPGEVCNVPQGAGAPVFNSAGGIMYIIPGGGGFRIVAYGPHFMGDDTYYGHGNGQADGYMIRGLLIQATCHA
jgi:hypothetical protein